MRGRGAGTDIREGIDPSALRSLSRGPGTDTRRWCEMGTVATLDDETGDWDFKDKRAVVNGPEGVEVDVRLEPLDQLVSCKYAGIQAGEVTIFAPIRPGDIVLVAMPQGGNTQPVIVAILQSRSKRQPLGPNRKPLFDNQRLLIHAKTVPIDIRLAGAAGATPVQVLLEQDGTVTTTGGKIVQNAPDVRLGGANPTEQAVLGTTQATELATLVGDLALAFTEIDVLLTSPASATAAAACTTFVAKLNTMLSNVVKVAP